MLTVDDLQAEGLEGEEDREFDDVNANWRMIFRFDGKDAKLVDYLDYH